MNSTQHYEIHSTIYVAVLNTNANSYTDTYIA